MTKRIAVVTGGFTGEAEIAFQSADVVIRALKDYPAEVIKVIITDNNWYAEINGKKITVDKNDFSITIGGEHMGFDAVFIAIHGTPGEDGKLQGYLDMLKIPHSTCGVLSAALTFDKKMCTDVLGHHDFNVAKSVLLNKNATGAEEKVKEVLRCPVFIKPNGAGSSLGISKVTDFKDLGAALDRAFAEDSEVIAEEAVEGTELTCGVVDYRGEPTALAVTEIVAANEFFDWASKYGNEQTREITPARIDQSAYDACMALSERIYKALKCRGCIRIDYIMDDDGAFYVIEVNTVPGLSEMSLIPQMVRYAGYSLSRFFTEAVNAMLSD